MSDLPSAAQRLRAAISSASTGLVEREALVELVALSAVAGEHLLVVGPPGTAKSEAVRRVARALGGRYFEYLLGRFTEPSEIFGPVDLRRLKEGVVETEIAGMLPEAEVAFLDEVFLGSTAILNTLLALLNERTFRRGHTRIACPLRICVAASNAIPDDPSLAAFADRFLGRIFLESIPDPQLEELLEGGWRLQAPDPGAADAAASGRDLQAQAAVTAEGTASLADLDALATAAGRADLSAVRGPLAHAIRLLRKAGVTLSDRRAVKVQRLIGAAAALAGRTSPTEADLWPIIYAVPTAEGQSLARNALRELLARSENATLPAASAEASSGPRARAVRLVQFGREALGARPAGGDDQALSAWGLRLEEVARAIDAGFAPEALPDDLRALREEIVKAVRARP